MRLLALVLGLGAGLAVAEIGLRLTEAPVSQHEVLAELAAGWEPPAFEGSCRNATREARLREIVQPSAHPDLIYELRPGIETCFRGVPVRTGIAGVRLGQESEAARRAADFRILALGDSHAFGWGIPADETVAARLEAALSAPEPPRVEVVNAGVPGYSAYQEAAWLEAHGAGFAPDCVLVLFVANDMGLPHFLLRPRPRGPSRLWDRIRSATSSKRWFSFAPNELATFVTEVDLARIPERYRHMVGEPGYREALAKMARWAESRDVALVNVFDYSSLSVDSGALVRFQEDLGITAVAMPWSNDSAFRLGDGDPHLNRAGNQAVVDSLLRELESRDVCLPPGWPG